MNVPDNQLISNSSSEATPAYQRFLQRPAFMSVGNTSKRKLYGYDTDSFPPLPVSDEPKTKGMLLGPPTSESSTSPASEFIAPNVSQEHAGTATTEATDPLDEAEENAFKAEVETSRALAKELPPDLRILYEQLVRLQDRQTARMWKRIVSLQSKIDENAAYITFVSDRLAELAKEFVCVRDGLKNGVDGNDEFWQNGPTIFKSMKSINFMLNKIYATIAFALHNNGGTLVDHNGNWPRKEGYTPPARVTPDLNWLGSRKK